MIKKLFIVRHGHADFSAKKDFDRVLTVKGIKVANKTAGFIQQICKDLDISLESCICSAANRTTQTAEIICFKNDIQKISSFDDLYSTVASKWVDKVSECEANNIVLVGHNPTLSQLVNNLSGLEVYMQPGDCAFITLEIKSDGIIYPAQLNQYYNHEQ